jgi:hypothetical protein
MLQFGFKCFIARGILHIVIGPPLKWKLRDRLHYSEFIAAPGQDPFNPAHYYFIGSDSFDDAIYLELKMTTVVNLLIRDGSRLDSHSEIQFDKGAIKYASRPSSASHG